MVRRLRASYEAAKLAMASATLNDLEGTQFLTTAGATCE
jgi:hypothetical protein